MDDIEANIQMLIWSIKHSAEYMEFQSAEKLLNEHPELARRVDEFRWRNFEMQTQAAEPEVFNVMGELSRESEKLHKIPVVHNYLQAELAVCRLLQNISLKIIDELDIHVPVR